MTKMNARFGKWMGALAALAVIGGCASSSEKAPAGGAKAGSEALSVGVVFDSGGRGDKSFNDSAYAGVDRAKKELGITDQTVDSKSEKDYETNLAALADQGVKLIFAVGFGQKAALEAVAPKYPDTRFAIIDAEVNAPNVRSIVFSEEQGSFLAGYAAALASRTGKIGFVGGKSIPLIKKFEVGYIAGAKTANPAIVLLPSKYTESWDDVALGKSAAKTLFDQGADVVYHAAGRCGLGVIGAAKEAGKLAIGVDSDQDDVEKGSVLTSMIKRVDEGVFQTIQDLKDGKFTNGTVVYDLAKKGVGLSDFRNSKDRLPADGMERIEKARAAIVEGKVKVPTTEDELKTFTPPTR